MYDVLVIDDDTEICDAVNSVVTRMDHGISSASTLESGLAKLEASPFDIALLELKLPDGDGLATYDWSGNVRELNQALEQALASAGPNPMLFPKDLPDEIRAKVIRKTFTKRDPQAEPVRHEGLIDPTAPLPVLKEARARVMEAFEKPYLEILLKQTRGNVKRACRVSGLSRSRFYTLIKKYNLSPFLAMIKAEQKTIQSE